MRQKTGNFNRIRNNEHGREKQKMNREQGRKYRALSCLSVGIGWLDMLHFWSRRALRGAQELSELWFAGVAPQSDSVSGLDPYFNHT